MNTDNLEWINKLIREASSLYQLLFDFLKQIRVYLCSSVSLIPPGFNRKIDFPRYELSILIIWTLSVTVSRIATEHSSEP